jgi:nitrilase
VDNGAAPETDERRSSMKKEKFQIAAIQAAPVYMNRDATVEKACMLIAEAAKKGARLAVLTEAFIPTYPDWIWNVPAGQLSLNQELYGELLEQSVIIPSPTTDRLCRAAKDAGIYVVIGVNERNIDASGGSLFNTLIYIDPNGNLIGRHQKLVPTAPERTIWAYGDPSTLAVYDTDLGKISGLICHENYMPLVRYSLYAQGVEIYFAPTYDESAAWQSTLRHIGREGRVYVVGCGMVLKKEDVLAHTPQLKPYYKNVNEWINTGNSMITGPGGEILAGPLSKEDGILYADVDLKMLRGMKWNLDVAGHYARPDAFHLTVSKAPTPIVSFQEDVPGSITVKGNEEESRVGGGDGVGSGI